MSMLAEKRRKQKWSLNPRGKAWSQDSSKFGQKLLEKMGWSQGKGLGAKEDGRTEHIKVSYKNDSQGVGYKESDDQWTEHETNFTALLAALGGGEQDEKNTESKIQSLEEKSQNSKARVHYRKFTRGKDISRYSEKDLANIFGKKSLKENKKIQKESINTEANNEIVKEKNFSNAGLMSDYFKKKIPSFGKSHGYVVGNNGVLKKDDDSETEQRPSFGFGFNTNKVESESESEIKPSFGFGFKSYVTENETTPKKKKDKKRVLDEDATNNEDTPSKKKKTDTLDETPTKKKKDKSKKKKPEDSGLANPAFDPLYSPAKLEKHILEPIDESMSESLNDTVGQVAENFEVQVQIINEGTPEVKKKEDDGTKKKKKRKDKNIDMDISIQSEDVELNSSINESKKKKKRKAKNLEETIEEMEVSTLNESTESNSNEQQSNIINSQDVSPKKKKSKSKEGIDNLVFNNAIESNISVPTIANPYEIPLKEKKKKKCGLENPMFNGEDNVNTQDIINEEYEVKRKSKKKKNKKAKEEDKGLTNPALDLNDTTVIEDEISCDLMLNIATNPTPIIEKPKTNKSFAETSIQKIKGVTRRKSVRFSDVTRERIIPTKEEIHNETLDESRDILEIEGKLNDSAELSYIDKFIQKKKAKKRSKGVDNTAFDEQANNIEENINSISKTLDNYQAEIENDINEAKMKSVEIADIMVGEVGNPEGENEKLPDGTVKLKFKKAKFKSSIPFMENLTGAKKSYKHLIKGDIVMGFKETNLHEIAGYAIKT
ncbi:unnamed protein product [Ceutorhynchus assimilis]|uniref:G-patch domain-containing protein n=1 Tax=Ceutorhynchus assimilis TaxID=467358 RepID=A0A9N9MYW3_9CUCU|nr:unnamed protein product [Ceutorhynchus assimilis]